MAQTSADSLRPGDLPLSGVRVLELGHHLVGPLVAMYLSDFGADVVKLEPPDGDPWRRVEVYEPLAGSGRFFVAINRNKRSIAVDLRREAGRQIARRLAASADVAIENFTPGVAARLGVDHETLARINPRLIYCSISAFGQTGPDARRRGFDLIVAGMTGLMVRQGQALPQPAPVAMTDATAALLAAFGVMVALAAREKSGVGQRVDTSLLDAALALHAHRIVRVPALPAGLEVPVGAFYRTYRTADGFINIVAFDERLSERLLKAMGLEGVRSDPRFDSPMKMRRHAEDLAAILQETFLTRTTGDWLVTLEAAEVPCGPLRGLAALFDDPQVRHNRGIVEVDHPVAGRAEIPGVRVRLDKTPGAVRSPAPLLGQHTAEILHEAGYAESEVERLRREGVIHAWS